MIHVDDWLDDPANKDHLGREFLEHSRRPAMNKDHAWLTSNRPTAIWKHVRYTVVGSSRMGDVWLKSASNVNPNAFYDLRVDIAELTDWQSASTAAGRQE